MLSASQRKRQKISASSAFGLVTLLSGLLLVLIHARVEKQPQVLPVRAKAQISGQVINLEVAQTSQQQSMELMYRTELADTTGVLFNIAPPRPVNVWMKNMRFPLDIVFLQDEQIKAIQLSAMPCDSINCPAYSSIAAVDRVIQLRSGKVAQLGLKVGDRLPIQFLDFDTPQNLTYGTAN